MKIKRYYIVDKSWYDDIGEITPEFLEDIAPFSSIKEAKKIMDEFENPEIFKVEYNINKVKQ